MDRLDGSLQLERGGMSNYQYFVTREPRTKLEEHTEPLHQSKGHTSTDIESIRCFHRVALFSLQKVEYPNAPPGSHVVYVCLLRFPV